MQSMTMDDVIIVQFYGKESILNTNKGMRRERRDGEEKSNISIACTRIWFFGRNEQTRHH